MLSPLVMISAVSKTAGVAAQMPGPLNWFIASMIRVNYIWRIKQELQDVSKSQVSLVAAFMGRGLNFATKITVGGSLIEYPALAVEIGRRVQDCLHRYLSLYRTYQEQREILRGRTFQVNHHIGIKPSKFTAWIEPSTRMWVAVQVQVMVYRISAFVKNLFFFVYEVFNFSNEMIVLGEAVSFNPDQKDRAKNNFFLNTWNILKDISDHEDDIKGELKQRQETIDSFLSAVGSDVSVSQILSSPKLIKVAKAIVQQSESYVGIFFSAVTTTATNFAHKAKNVGTYVWTGEAPDEVVDNGPSVFNPAPLAATVIPINEIHLPVTQITPSLAITLEQIQARAQEMLTQSNCAYASDLLHTKLISVHVVQ